MRDLIPITLRDLKAEAEREQKQRERVYPRQVALGRMRQEAADRQIKLQAAIISVLDALADDGRLSVLLGQAATRAGYDNEYLIAQEFQKLLDLIAAEDGR